MQKKAVVIGSGFSGMSAASFLASAGWDVIILEKHSTPGGRARQFSDKGFRFDMGPSWYWMPEVFDRYFEQLGENRKEFYSLIRLSPSYRVYWENDFTDIPDDYEKLQQLFEQIETGSSAKLDQFLKEAKYKYHVGIENLVLKPGLSIKEFADTNFLKGLLKLDVFTSMKKHIKKYFKSEKLQQLLEFPTLFLGALPENTPALYSLMNYADIKLGTWYPEGGMYKIAEAMHTVAEKKGVKFFFNHTVEKISINKTTADEVFAVSGSNKVSFIADVVIGSADYHFIEKKLLPDHLQSYSDDYWNSRKMAPSCLLFYVGINKKIPDLQHHSLFFDADFEQHALDIYKDPKWPERPLFYVSATSVSDNTVAPEGHENLFFLIPVAAGLKGDTESMRKEYFTKIFKRFQHRTGQDLNNHIVFYKSFGPSDFVSEYNSFKGNAYGLANTLMQTAILKPSCKSKKVSNLYYTGQLTVPGPGVPPSLISGEVVAKQIIKKIKSYD
ncbi:phytoene desaturase family protein [soil metagenome]